MALTARERVDVQRLYDQMLTHVSKYGSRSAVIIETVTFEADENDKVTGLVLNINAPTPPDVDGDSVNFRKGIDIW